MQKDCQYALEVAIEAAHQGAIYLKHFWGNLSTIRSKSTSGDLVTEADERSEQAIKEILQTAFPKDGILAEESGKTVSESTDRLWLIDPLDGTTNYTHQYPFVAVSIGLLWKGELVVGVVYNPFMEELFTAFQNGGAFLNNQPIHVSQVPSLQQALLSTGFSYDRRINPENNYQQFCKLTDTCQGVRRCGAASLDLAYVAAGRLDGYWERGLQPWDIAAGALLVREAGGLVTAYDSQPLDLFQGRVIATNQLIHQELCQELSS